jgi:hypothetical protein
MYKKLSIFALILFMAIFSREIYADQDKGDKKEQIVQADSLKQKDASPSSDKVFAYYFHGDRRCTTCRKLEAYSGEAFQVGFKTEIADSTLVWRAVNYDRKENKHFIDDYKLYTKTLILSHVRGGKEIEWVNLDKIWQLVRDKDKFIRYVQTETRKFLDREDAGE